MQKRWISFFVTLVFLLGSCLGVQAALLDEMPDAIPEERQLPRLVDEADLLTSGEEAKLLKQLDQISEAHQCDVAVITLTSTGGRDAQSVADDVYDYYGFGMGSGDSGILLLISMAERDWVISTYGFGIEAFTDAGMDYMADEFVPSMSDGDYSEAFECFASLCDDFLEQAESGEPYDVGHLPRKPLSPVWIFVSIGVGAVVALIIVSAMAAGLKTVNRKNNAADYTRPGSLQLQQSYDMFLYRNVRRAAKANQSGSSSKGGSSSHRSSSGRSHGGSRGKF